MSELVERVCELLIHLLRLVALAYAVFLQLLIVLVVLLVLVFWLLLLLLLLLSCFLTMTPAFPPRRSIISSVDGRAVHVAGTTLNLPTELRAPLLLVALVGVLGHIHARAPLGKWK